MSLVTIYSKQVYGIPSYFYVGAMDFINKKDFFFILNTGFSTQQGDWCHSIYYSIKGSIFA